MLGRSTLGLAVVLAGCCLIVACGGGTAPSGQAVTASPAAPAQGGPSPVPTISDRYGPSWSGRLGDTVQIDWTDETGESYSERIAVLAVKRLADRTGDGGNEGYVAYKRHYAIKVRLTSLDARAARWPQAYQLLQLSDGAREESGVWGLGEKHGPDPSRVGQSSVGWLHQRAQQGFVPAQVVIDLPGSTISWRLD